MRGAVAAVTMRNDFFLRDDSLCRIHLFQFLRRFHEAIGIEIIGPFQVYSTGNGSAAGSADPLAGIFIIGASIDDYGERLVQPGKNVVNGREQLAPLFHFKIAGLGDDNGLMSDRQSGRLPGGAGKMRNYQYVR